MFSNYLNNLSISLGTVVKVERKNSFDESLELLYDNKKASVSKIVAQNLYIKTDLH